MYWVNGQATDMISLRDRSFQYGDGCFTTMLVKDSQVQHWDKHKARMQSCLELLGITPPNWQQVESWLRKAIIADAKSGLKLHISRGEGGRGYSPNHVMSPSITINAFNYPIHYERWLIDGIRLGICTLRLGLNPLLAGHKHNNRLEQVLLKAEMDKEGLPDGVVLDINDNVIETTSANIFWVKEDVIYTPDLSNAGVKGVMQRVIIDFAAKNKIDVKTGQYSLEELFNADEVFVSNSLLGVAQVDFIGKQAYDKGPITKQIQEMVNS
ncbi:aminodeoxychorismate lyase [Vibrio pectenicida]|uniref:Aminodeoxychorismate lyase n=1 Tax=Vibrio pectenicida TaxID=62763 RepID=A0A7Y3ZXK2_9VIBR|nr:aminodeoxychorismate lyase [Vibrio pectenicida]NOH70952.1 aminodeoxychorismate lyase [Vibrio pectenicida]